MSSSAPTPKKPIWKMQNPHAPRHYISSEPNFEKTPCTPTQETIPWKERKSNQINPLSKNSFGKGGENPKPYFLSFPKFSFNNLMPPPLHSTCPHPTLKRKNLHLNLQRHEFIKVI
jgi:hypothetical protein